MRRDWAVVMGSYAAYMAQKNEQAEVYIERLTSENRSLRAALRTLAEEHYGFVPDYLAPLLSDDTTGGAANG